MPELNRLVRPGRTARSVLSESGLVLVPPEHWSLLPPGDAALTRRVKEMGPVWLVQVKMGRRLISKGIWADSAHIASARMAIEDKRATPEYARKRETDLARRHRLHEAYVEEFYLETLRFLDFHPRHRVLAEGLARRVTDHATPVGSGTVARTERIPLSERVRAAIIAWMRHQTTSYDSMKIARIHGRRREVRRQLAERSTEILATYRSDCLIDQSTCPLWNILTEVSPD
ncbi:MAG: DUF2293 domain-containing protein [Desulfoprunum sp.]|nr:DUF2293 domain-containing protein [Desulfoprunum sp.]